MKIDMVHPLGVLAVASANDDQTPVSDSGFLTPNMNQIQSNCKAEVALMKESEEIRDGGAPEESNDTSVEDELGEFTAYMVHKSQNVSPSPDRGSSQHR